MLIKMLFQYFKITPISFQDGMNHESHNLLSFDSKITRCFFKRNLTYKFFIHDSNLNQCANSTGKQFEDDNVFSESLRRRRALKF